jgi:hypothetical protein
VASRSYASFKCAGSVIADDDRATEQWRREANAARDGIS